MLNHMRHANLVTVILSLIIAILIGSIAFLLIPNKDQSSVEVIPTVYLETENTPIDNKLVETAPTIISDGEPNVLLIILDDIGLDFFPGFLEQENFDKARMPVAEALMSDGYIFTNLNTYAMCSPTRASLLTGHHGIDTGVLDPGKTSYLDPKWQSIQNEIKSLSHSNVTSAVIGKWHLLGKDGDISHPNLFVDYYSGIPTGNHESYFEWDKVVNGVEVGSDTYVTTDLTNTAISWINDQDDQWFTWLAYTAPHSPLHLPPSDLHTYDDLSGDENDLKRNKDEYFKAMLESVDTEIGRLLDSLSQEDKDNTYVILIGDNGTGTNAPEEFRSVGIKGSLHVGGIHTPMVVFSPYQNGGGQRVDNLISTIDFFPTILDILNLDSLLDLPGNSFYPLVAETSESYSPHDFIFSQNLEGVTVRTDSYRLIRSNEGDEELFDINEDFFEQTNILDSNNLSASDQQGYDLLSETLDEFLKGNY